MEKTKGELHQPSNEYKTPVIQLQGTCTIYMYDTCTINTSLPLLADCHTALSLFCLILITVLLNIVLVFKGEIRF